MNIMKKVIIGLTLLLAGVLFRGFSISNTSIPEQVVEVNKSVLTSDTPAPTPVKSVKAKVTRLDVSADQILLLNTEVNSESVEILIAAIEALSEEHKELYMVLDSPGGSVFDGSRLISYMEASRANINTVSYGMCASMCAQIFGHGKKRYMVDRSTLMYHPAAGGLRGTLPEMKSLLAYIDIETQKLDAYIADRAKIDRVVFENMVLRNLWIAADDAIAKNLADGLVVISPSKESSEIFNMHKELLKRNIVPKTRNINPLTEIY